MTEERKELTHCCGLWMCFTECQMPSTSAGNQGNLGPCSICFSKNTCFCIRKYHSNPIITNYLNGGFFCCFWGRACGKEQVMADKEGSLNCIIMWQQQYLIMLFSFIWETFFPSFKNKKQLVFISDDSLEKFQTSWARLNFLWLFFSPNVNSCSRSTFEIQKQVLLMRWAKFMSKLSRTALLLKFFSHKNL